MEDITFKEGQLSKLLLFDERAAMLDYPEPGKHNGFRVRTALREACGGLWHVDPSPPSQPKIAKNNKKKGAGNAFLARLMKSGGGGNNQGNDMERTETVQEKSKRMWRKVRGVAHVTGAFKQEGKKRLLRRRMLGKFGPQHENDKRVAYLRAKYGVRSALAQAELLPASLKELQDASKGDEKEGWQRNIPLRFSKRTARDTGNLHGALIYEVKSKRNMVEKGLMPLEDALDGLFRKERERRARMR